MKLAVMQPYFFPYLGYYQLIHSVDRFVFLDDVTFIKQGWINRNRILLQGEARLITVPLSRASSNRRICDVELSHQPWRAKLEKTFDAAYRKAPYYAEVAALFAEVIHRKGDGTIAELASDSVRTVTLRLGLSTEFVESTRGYSNEELRGQDRVLDVCRREEASVYVNPPGGRELYDAASFAREDIELLFLEPVLAPYVQGRGNFEPGLSILDVLMFNGFEGTRSMVEQYRLEGAELSP